MSRHCRPGLLLAITLAVVPFLRAYATRPLEATVPTGMVDTQHLGHELVARAQEDQSEEGVGVQQRREALAALRKQFAWNSTQVDAHLPPDAVCPYGPSTRTQIIEWWSSGSKDASKICKMQGNPVGNDLCITRGKGFEDTGPNRAKPLWVLCTSCPSNTAFHFLFHKARVGVCKPYGNTQEITCRELGSNS